MLAHQVNRLKIGTNVISVQQQLIENKINAFEID